MSEEQYVVSSIQKIEKGLLLEVVEVLLLNLLIRLVDGFLGLLVFMNVGKYVGVVRGWLQMFRDR